MRTLGFFGLTLVVLFSTAAGCDSGDRAPAREPSNPPVRAFSDPGAASPQSQAATAPTSPRATVIGPNRSEDTATSVPPPMMDIDRSFAGKNEQPSSQTQAKTEQPLTDGQILGIALAANEGEVLMAELAMKKANLVEVKQFAGMMKTHHGAGVQKTKGVVAKTKLETSDSDVVQSLKSDVSAVIKDLHDKDSIAFDRAYMNAQVKAHKDVLLAMDSRMIPSVTNGEVRLLLVEMRKTVAEHLVKAEAVTKKVEQTPSAAMPPSTKGENHAGRSHADEPRTPPPRETPSGGKQADQSKAKQQPGLPPRLSPDRH
jgi:putative membrane protein